nr:complement factor H-like [Dasypus novemcinctus]
MPVFENARARSKGTWFKLNDKLDYECNDGYESRDGRTTGSIVCGDGGWSDTPTCLVKPCDFPNIKHGHLHPGQPKGNSYYYHCNANFVTPTKKSSGHLTCTQGRWSPAVPCQRQCIFYSVENGHSLNGGNRFVDGQSVNMVCKPGYSLPFGASKITCTEHGWSPPPRCILVKTCSKVDIKIYNGFFSESDYTYPLNKKTHYRCKSGYIIPEGKTSGSIKCLQSGWSAQPTCIKSCDMPVFENARARSKGTWFKLNDKLDYECNDGYESRDGHTTGSIVCGDGGWSGTPTCLEKLPCSQPPLIEHGYIESSRFSAGSEETANPRPYNHGNKLRYKCEDGFSILEEDGITCHMGKWISIPQCIGNPCKEPPMISYGAPSPRLDSYQHGEEVTYNCEDGFGIDGPASIKCLGGKWPNPPECKNVSCVSPPVVENANIISSLMDRYPPGERVRYECMESFDIFGEVEVMCLNGTWTEPPKCGGPKAKCGIPPAIDNGDLVTFPRAEYAPGTSLEYQCKSYYELQGNPHVTCRNGQWSEPPKCLRHV